ncbi:MAG TPA: molybdate ABC transporter substrate-binding protein [Microvirga sp.]|nr:molybdate ABC transporter substrate-binding protein [Microvirga sp.]
MRAFAKALVATAAVVLSFGPAFAQATDVTVFAAASLKNALDAIAADYQRDTGKRVAIAYAASSSLARQIVQGAPADLFISADLEWMDYLEQSRLVRPETRRSLLGNRLVVIAPVARPQALDLEPAAFVGRLGPGRLALAAVATVPAGKYAKAALQGLGLWTEVAGRLAEAENARAALAFVSRGEAPLGIVYETDARADPNVAVVARIPEASHPPIVYPAALTAAAKGDEPARFLAALGGPAARAAFAREGFIPLD